MLRFVEKPYHLLLISVVFLLIAALSPFNYPVEIHLSDTYLIVNARIVTWALIFTLVLIWMIYALTRYFLFSRVLIWSHIILTIVCDVCLVAIPYFFQYSSAGAGGPRRYFDHGDLNSYKIFGNMTPSIGAVIFILIAGQSLLLVNILVGLFKNHFAHSKHKTPTTGQK